MIRDLSSDAQKTFVFDLDGVVYVDRTGVPGAGQTLAALDGAGHQVLFATNNSSRAVDTVIENIRIRTGYRTHADSVITSGLAAADLLRDDGEACFVLGSEELEETLAAAGIEVTSDHDRATTVVVGLDRSLTYQRLTSAVLAVRCGARFVATSADPTYPTPEGQYPGTGAIVAAVERSTGVHPVLCGKPSAPMQELIEQRIEHPTVWMVGDRAETDLALADRAGWGKILVLTGVTDHDNGPAGSVNPDYTIGSIVDLEGLMSTRKGEARG